MNLIDGSSVWLQAVAQTLTSLPWVEVTLPLRVGEKRDVLTAALRDHPRIELLDPTPSDDRALGRRRGRRTGWRPSTPSPDSIWSSCGEGG